ncbi:hypothetical protein [Chitinilyticum piscinae]|uniref:Uncharacterized protein n=1 Tax=Chitinilyticum piscinae TaxID=2866724 RepID=A0A8J7FJ71_9NEIS|nr:hypothetical protein [Chitinilyticum piscinae]MBE9610330.1 hypothetical protein [Chitinilyticum piscinae]
MLPNRPLNEYLPQKFANGEQVRQFSKPCVQCGTMLHARHMHGVARLVEDHIAIAAKARCPSCGANFPVACVIDSTKQVRRVILPRLLFNLYLRSLGAQPGEAPAGARLDEVAFTPPPAAVANTAPAAAPSQSDDVLRAEDPVGRYQDRPIPAWVEIKGRRLQFDRVALNASGIQPGEYLLDGCLVYRQN